MTSDSAERMADLVDTREHAREARSTHALPALVEKRRRMANYERHASRRGAVRWWHRRGAAYDRAIAIEKGELEE